MLAVGDTGPAGDHESRMSLSLSTEPMNAHHCIGAQQALPSQCFSNFQVHANHLRILLKADSKFTSSGVGLEISSDFFGERFLL